MRGLAWLLVLALLAGCSHRVPPPGTVSPAAVVVPTADGASVQLHRHPAQGPPVLLVHGLGSRAAYWDLMPDRSLASFLRTQGFDVWLLDLRGHGGHQRTASGRHLSVGWTLDDYGRFDLDAAINHIRDTTGHETVSAVGHSLGGMALAVYQAWHGDSALASVVVLGSPMDFHHPDPLVGLARSSLAVGKALPAFPTPAAGRLFQHGRLPFHAEALLFNPDNLDRETQRAVFVQGTGPVSRGEMRHLLQTLRTGRFESMDGSRAYLAHLETLSVPLLVVAGRRDVVAPPDRVRPFFDAAGSPDKRWVLAGRDDGFLSDYGHLDLTLGTHAPAEIYPLVAAWLREHRREPQNRPATANPAASRDSTGPR